VLGEQGGVEQVTLTLQQIPSHNHQALARTSQGNLSTPTGGIWAASALNQFAAFGTSTPMRVGSIGQTGQSQPHTNMMPYLCVGFIISFFGIYPSQF
jgi:microcystin-dependent protein